MAKLVLISGSLRGGSTNSATVRTAATLAPDGVEAEIYDGMGRLPHFNPDDDPADGVGLHPEVAVLRAALAAADALLVSTPEYAGALPGSFKNLLDWTVGGGQTYGMPVAWINVSGAAAPTGGADAHESLRKVLGYSGAQIIEDAVLRLPLSRGDVGEDGLIAPHEAREAIVGRDGGARPRYLLTFATVVWTKQVDGRRERGEGSAQLVRDPIRATEDAEMRRSRRRT